MTTYFEGAGKQIEQQQATFKDITVARAKAWREAAGQFREAAGKVAEAWTTDIDAALKQLKSDASEAEARLQKLKQAGKSPGRCSAPRWQNPASPSIKQVGPHGTP